MLQFHSNGIIKAIGPFRFRNKNKKFTDLQITYRVYS